MRFEIALVRSPIFLTAVLLAGVVHADVVELKTGQRVEGTLKQADQVTVSVEVGGQVVTFKAEQVKTIHYGGAPASVATAPADAQGEALKALRTLESGTSAGMTYRDYAPRVADTKAVVDRYLSGKPEGEAVQGIAVAMGYYVIASSSWSGMITKRHPSLPGAERLPLETCEALRVAIKPKDPAITASRYRELMISSIKVNSSVLGDAMTAPLWSCASAKLAEVEKLLSGAKP
jgi:hypothetical protein